MNIENNKFSFLFTIVVKSYNIPRIKSLYNILYYKNKQKKFKILYLVKQYLSMLFFIKIRSTLKITTHTFMCIYTKVINCILK